jgi:hypothetical protein
LSAIFALLGLTLWANGVREDAQAENEKRLITIERNLLQRELEEIDAELQNRGF